MSEKDIIRDLIPRLMNEDWWDIMDYPERIMDQCFGMELFEHDLFPAFGLNTRRRRQTSIADSGQSEVKNVKDKFQVGLDVKLFKPEEVKVKVVDKYVVVHGKHEERSDTNGFVSREFTRRYMLPNACDAETVNSSLSADGMLTIVAPKKAIEAPVKKERNVPVKIKGRKCSGDGL
ncbi:alpha-crystallin A chain [Caerostris darwini]|uniref:Alpha-crystallin A chain n=1 Tax=Caerostris darwini TaxID=1538125 RepID=A0AAV4QF22_9ARAC|nr:alpha-crystallin A chain [Caerostris darwini]